MERRKPLLRLRRTGGEGELLYWLLKYVLLGPWLRILFRPQVEGREYVPDEGPAIIASNHVSFSDSIFMPLMVKRKVTFVAKSEYFTGTNGEGKIIHRHELIVELGEAGDFYHAPRGE